ncbi:Universal stress protein family protein [Caballeronia arvi]|uniref:Universal stress protein family protein n=1 Tax=Caballeronia arvi TaxID=1777135 RepID=A0A158GEY2_9BURK|nr:universal stress protein [Caballeronia arvi]SAL30473.1 Universal stress protein family protein [Caballeronia arvi]
MYQHILAAVGPGFSEAALSTAIARARESHARLTVLHVIETAPWWAGWQADSLCDTPSLVNQLALVVRRHSEKILRREGVDADWQMRRLPEDGRSIGRVIADTANRLDADLIVLGGGKRGLFGLGTSHVRNVVCRHTDREVLIATASDAPKARVSALHGALLQARQA